MLPLGTFEKYCFTGAGKQINICKYMYINETSFMSTSEVLSNAQVAFNVIGCLSVYTYISIRSKLSLFCPSGCFIFALLRVKVNL